MKIIQSFFMLHAFVLPSSQAYNLRESRHLNIYEARIAMAIAMAYASTNSSRVTELRDALSRIYEVAPKNELGLLDHQVVRYVLHRFFQQRKGWFIKGLAPNETQSWHRDSSANIAEPIIKDWVPSLLQDILEQGSMQKSATNLTGLVQLTVALEELVRIETRDRMNMVYEMHGWPADRRLMRNEVHALSNTFFFAFLSAGNFPWEEHSDVAMKEQTIAQALPDHAEERSWLAKIVQEYLLKMGNGVCTFESAVQLAWTIQERYHEFNDRDCRGMKNALMQIESKKAGRTRLSTFYNKSFYSTFRFGEKAEYLKTLGVLDDSDPQNPQVIISNYIVSRPNCLEGSSIYALCCRNECEDLLGKIESQLRSSAAKPKDIVNIVCKLSTQTVHAPRVLGRDLVTRLESVAAQSHGQVPLHGRLFSQWMHHAFPRECPYPHQTGSATPLTPEEWMASRRQSDAIASLEEMQEIVESAVCEVDQGKVKGICGEDESLPWSDKEELLGVHFVSQNAIPSTAMPSPNTMHRLAGIEAPLSVAMSLMAVGVLFWDYFSAKRDYMASKKDQVLYANRFCQADIEQRLTGFKKALGLWIVAFIIWALELADASVLGWTICSYMLVLVGRTVFQRHSVT